METKDERSFSVSASQSTQSQTPDARLTEIRGPYYSVRRTAVLEDLFELMGNYVDSLKFAGGSFALMPEAAVRNIIELCHHHNVLVSTGGFLEHVLAQGGRRCAAICCRM